MPTALELTRSGWKTYLESPRPMPVDHVVSAETDAARELLIALVRDAADLLRDHLDVERVILFGSLVDRGWFSPESDVDLAVEGLAPEDYWEAWRLVESVVGARPVDLIELEGASDALRRTIERDGIEL